MPTWSLDMLKAAAITAVCTVVVFPLQAQLGAVNIVMIYLLGTTLGALRLGRGACIALPILNILAFDFCFVPPVFSFDVEDTRYLLAMLVMLVVALVVANLMVGIRRNRDASDVRERRTAVLLDMSRELAAATEPSVMARAAARHIGAVFRSATFVLVADEAGALSPLAAEPEGAIAAFHREQARAALLGGERCRGGVLYLPLRAGAGMQGVIVVQPQPSAAVLPAEQRALLDAFAAQLASALQRVQSAAAAALARVEAERARMRSTLLASISHDLRTPLAAIAGAGGLIAQTGYAINAERRSMLGLLIERKACDMTRLLSNVLELSRLEAGAAVLRTDWHAVEDLVSNALQSNEARLARWRVLVNVPADLPLILVEGTLIVQMLTNLLENAVKYTPAGTTIRIDAELRAACVVMSVADDGPGLPPGDPERWFDDFHRSGSGTGVGLGLAICRVAARLHGGEIRARERAGAGAHFEITLPIEAIPVEAVPVRRRA